MANFSGLSKYIQESWMELKHVTWPTKAELKKHTLLVIAFSIAVAVFLGLCDYIINAGIENIFIK